jgi:hypothetical protein
MKNLAANDYSGIASEGKLYVIPNDPVMHEQLLAIDRMTKDTMAMRHKAILSQDWQCNTIACCYLECLIEDLGLEMRQTNSNASLNFYDLMQMNVTIKRNEDAEKEGNINIEFIAGDRIADIIGKSIADASNEQKETYIDPEIAFGFGGDKNAPGYVRFANIDRATIMMLSRKYYIVSPKEWFVTAISYTFLENLIKYMVIKLVNEGTSLVSINFNDIIEFHATRVDDESVSITMRPGMDAKLLIKSDELTENDDDE